MTAFVDKGMALARGCEDSYHRYLTNNTNVAGAGADAMVDARAALRTHLESGELSLRQALEALESCDGDDGLKGYRQFHDEKLVEPAIAAIKQALEPK